ncbi:molybdate ABC transporter substrate-binding protein [Bradyrhizobium sp. GCM10028915]|uniref:molybdate ABC transporter substrate-binding protein n=1 Tax=Bradyrhizobium sp. GCM10028915 TaxID=3273385 RepID=UPI003619F2AB
MMKQRSILSVSGSIVLTLALFGIAAGSTAAAAEIKLLCAVALQPAMDVLIPDFENTSGHKVTVAYGNAGAIADRFKQGEAADLVINAAPLMEQLGAQGKVIAGDHITIAKVGVSAFVRKGAANPDMSSADAFKRSILAAKSIIYPDPAGGGASGIYMASLLERLGIAAEMRSKTKLSPSAKVLYASVASGDVEIGFNQISEVLAQPTVEFAGALPSAIQNYTNFAPGIVTTSNQTEAARALVTFLTSRAAKAVLQAKGFE